MLDCELIKYVRRMYSMNVCTICIGVCTRVCMYAFLALREKINGNVLKRAGVFLSGSPSPPLPQTPKIHFICGTGVSNTVCLRRKMDLEEGG